MQVSFCEKACNSQGSCADNFVYHVYSYRVVTPPHHPHASERAMHERTGAHTDTHIDTNTDTHTYRERETVRNLHTLTLIPPPQFL